MQDKCFVASPSGWRSVQGKPKPPAFSDELMTRLKVGKTCRFQLTH